MRTVSCLLNIIAACLVLLASLSAGCSDSAGPAVDVPATPPVDESTEIDESAVRTATLGSMTPVSQTGDIYLAGQPTVEDIALMKAKGIKTVISLRKEDEIDWNEEKIVDAAGLRFVRIPFASAGELNANVFEQVRTLLRDAETQPVVLHCGVANRVGAVWLPYRVLDQGVPLDEAVREARAAGLQSEDLERKARAYVRRQQAAEDGSPPSVDEDASRSGSDSSSADSDASSVDDDASVAQ